MGLEKAKGENVRAFLLLASIHPFFCLSPFFPHRLFFPFSFPFAGGGHSKFLGHLSGQSGPCLYDIDSCNSNGASCLAAFNFTYYPSTWLSTKAGSSEHLIESIRLPSSHLLIQTTISIVFRYVTTNMVIHFHITIILLKATAHKTLLILPIPCALSLDCQKHEVRV